VNIVSNSGDGGALAIGLRSFLHTLNRGSRITIVVLINEFYANTGFQYGPTATLYADTSTTPRENASFGNPQLPMDHIGLAVMAGASLVAQVSPAFPRDFAEMTTAALECDGTAVLFVPSPCISGWKYDDGRTVELARTAARSGLFPVFFKRRGEEGKVKHVDPLPQREEKLLEFLAAQQRFAHLARFDEATQKAVIQPGAGGGVRQLREWIDRYLDHLDRVRQLWHLPNAKK
jgi:pyruvate/2-oxoacid:ferredoxin oxidoreductase beta subunit